MQQWVQPPAPLQSRTCLAAPGFLTMAAASSFFWTTSILLAGDRRSLFRPSFSNSAASDKSLKQNKKHNLKTLSSFSPSTVT
jgi:hypothetical protein